MYYPGAEIYERLWVLSGFEFLYSVNALTQRGTW